MTHACTTLPAISPVQIAIAAHRAAYDAFQVAPEGDEALHAEDAYDEGSMALVAVACTNAAEALAQFRHLAWWVLDEAEFASGHQPAYDIAIARARDLSLYLNTLTGPTPLPQAMPSGRVAHAVVARRPVADEPAFTPSLHRLLGTVRVTGEFATAVVLIAGGVLAYGFLPPL